MPHNSGGVGGKYLSVPLLDDYHLVAIEAGGLDVYGLAREEPANCQRLKPSLREPSLLSVDGDLMRSGDVGEGREGCDPVGIRV